MTRAEGRRATWTRRGAVLAAAMAACGLAGASAAWAQECLVTVKTEPLAVPVAVIPGDHLLATPVMAVRDALGSGETNQPVGDTLKALDERIPLKGWKPTPATFALKPGRWLVVADRAAVKDKLDDLATSSEVEPPPPPERAVRQTIKDNKLAGVVTARMPGDTSDLVSVLAVEGSQVKLARVYAVIVVAEDAKTSTLTMDVSPIVFHLSADAVKPQERYTKGSGAPVTTRPADVPATPEPVSPEKAPKPETK
jgi:hypothetical protein